MPFMPQGSHAVPSPESSPPAETPAGAESAENSPDAAEPASSNYEQPDPYPSPMPKRHILVVDDDEWIRDLLQRVLLRHHYDVDTVAGGEQALAALRTDAYDLVISDIRMPGMD